MQAAFLASNNKLKRVQTNYVKVHGCEALYSLITIKSAIATYTKSKQVKDCFSIQKLAHLIIVQNW